MRRTLPMLLAGALLAGCATTPSVQITEGKIVADLWTTFDATAKTLDSLALAGSLSASEKVTIATDGAKIRDALNAATTAVNASDQATAAQNVATVTALMVDLTTIIATHKGA